MIQLTSQRGGRFENYSHVLSIDKGYTKRTWMNSSLASEYWKDVLGTRESKHFFVTMGIKHWIEAWKAYNCAWLKIKDFAAGKIERKDHVTDHWSADKKVRAWIAFMAHNRTWEALKFFPVPIWQQLELLLTPDHNHRSFVFGDYSQIFNLVWYGCGKVI